MSSIWGAQSWRSSKDAREKRLEDRARAPPRLVVCLLIAIGLCWGLLGVGEAGAATPSFGARGHGAGEFLEAHALAVSQEAGEVVIADENNARVDVFARGGAFLRAFGWGVADGAEELQSCTVKCLEGREGAGAGELRFPRGIAVDNDPLSSSHGDVYVGDSQNDRVQKYTPGGEFLWMVGGEVNATSKGNLCLAGEACQAGSEGPGPGQFEATSAVAVDSSGTLYVGDRNRVQRFSPAGALEGEVALAGCGLVESLALDAAKEMYVKCGELPGIRKYDSAGVEIEALDEAGAPGAFTLGPAGELLLDDESEGVHHIFVYDAAGKQSASFDAAGQGTSALAFDEVTEALYALGQSAVRVLEVPPPGPLVQSQSAEEITTTGATLTALVNPEGPEATGYHFEYGTSTAYGQSTTSEELPPGGEFEDHRVSAPIAGLQPSGTYHFRVVLENAGRTTFGEDQSFTTLPPVSIDGESALQVSAFSARLQAQLNPHGLPTEYHFEYGTTTAYGQSVPTPEASAGSANEDQSFEALIQGLSPGTLYHYRVVAHNSLGSVQGEDQSFSTQGPQATALLDGRAWEMVSPVKKQGVSFESIAGEGAVIQAAADGSALSYVAKAPISSDPQGNRSIANSQVLSRRESPGDWSSQDIATKHELVAGLTPGFLSEYQIFSPELESALVEPQGATPLSPQTSERTPYRREADGSYTPLVTAANVPAGVEFGGTENKGGGFENGTHFITATPDQSHVLLASPQSLTSEVKSGELPNIFEWSSGTLRLVSIMPNGVPSSEEGKEVAVGRNSRIVRHAVSDDGNRVLFEASGGGRHLYLRDMALGQTVQIDAAEAGLKEAGGELAFQTASADGSRVLFLDTGKLTSDSTAREGQPDLYECEVTVNAGKLGCALKDLTVDQNPGESANVQGVVMGADESGRYIYLAANGRLAAGAAQGDCHESFSSAQSCNLYALDSVAGTTRLIGALSGGDFRDWGLTGTEDLGSVTSRVSPNGQYLTFMSQRPLTGFDNRDAVSGERDEEVFEYSRAAATLACVSCASSGARPEGLLDPGGFPGLLVDRPALWQGQWLAASVPGWTRVDLGHALYQSRYLADSGRMFFNSATPLVAADGNGLEDVYEYEPAGVGGCTLPSGCIGLSSSGETAEESAFLDASADGSDVFFLSSGRLSGTDVDSAYDVYDAHVCSASAPCASPAAATPPPCGTADACRAAPAPQPDIFGAPSSETFKGQGNVAPATAKAKKPPTRAQKLSAALKGCKKKKGKAKRAACVKRAKKLYGPIHKKKHAKKSAAKGRGKR